MADLNPGNILAAYAQGVFPMAHPDTGVIHWFRPDPRAVLPLDGFHVSRSFRRFLGRRAYEVTFDLDFDGVLAGCADREETWISGEIAEAYGSLHRLGWAHSVEVWLGKRLVGGVYGVAIGGAFMAESMFSRETNASKVALLRLVERLRERGFELLDVQYMTEHLASLGAVDIPGGEYLRLLRHAVAQNRTFGP